MVTLSRKQREIQQREAQILSVARGHLLEGGYLGLSMDRIATEMEYSKGTIYQHFKNKEEIILAMANVALEVRANMFERAAMFSGRSRQRIVAIGTAAEVFVERYPHHFKVEQIIRSSSIWEKTSDERRNYMQGCEARCMGIVGGVVRDAIAAGDLQLPEGRSPEDLVFGLWSMNFGAYTILTSSDSLQDVGIADGVAALRHNQNCMLDGYHWQPLSTEFDYAVVNQQVRQEMFSHESN